MATNMTDAKPVKYPKRYNTKHLVKDLRSRLGDIPALLARHISLARQVLRKLLDGHILCEPIMEGEKAGYRFTATGTFDRLRTGFKVVNESGGGQPIQPSLIPLLRFEIQGVALVA